MILVTLIVSYALSVLSAVVHKRSFAGQVTALGKRSEDFVVRAWNGRNFLDLELPLNTYAARLGTLTEQHLAYPILYYYHARQGTKASPVAAAILDEALTILRYGVPEKHRPSPAVLSISRETVGSYLDSLGAAFIRPADEAPPPPDLSRLREAGIPTVSDEEFALALARESERRRRLLGALRNGAWRWPSDEGR